MISLRYAVLNHAGVKINGIMVTDPYPADYWPGYGRYIVCEFGEPDPVPPECLDIRDGERPFTYLTIRPQGPFGNGDTMDLETGAITYAPPAAPVPDILADIEAVDEH